MELEVLVDVAAGPLAISRQNVRTVNKPRQEKKWKKKKQTNLWFSWGRLYLYNLYPSFSSQTSKGLTRFNWDGLLFSMTDKSPHFWVAGLLLAPHAISERPKTGSDIEPKAADIYCTRGWWRQVFTRAPSSCLLKNIVDELYEAEGVWDGRDNPPFFGSSYSSIRLLIGAYRMRIQEKNKIKWKRKREQVGM